MAFDKQEVKQLKSLFDEHGNRIEKRINRHTDEKIEELARMTAAEFREVHKRLDKNEQEHKEFCRDLAAHDFNMSELVHKAEYYHLEERVHYIENRLKIKPAT